MISPLWMLNSALAVISIATLVIIMLTQEQMPARTTIKPDPAALQRKKDSSKIVDITRIYQNDLFGTYVAPQPPQPEEPPRILPLPEPPTRKPIIPPTQAQPVFLSPLPLTLKGIIIATNDQDTRAIIAETQSGKEGLYSIDDVIEDAELIHISHNRIILIRSNGQQETIFLTNKETKTDPIYNLDKPWTNVIRQINETTYSIDPKAFATRITSLAQLLDMLDMTTVFQNGLSVGSRIGRLSPKSIGPALGLHDNDIIVEINGISPLSTSSRIAIYETIKNSSLGDTINTRLLRNNQELTLLFTLESFDTEKDTEPLIPGTPLPPKPERNETIKNLLAQAPQLDVSVQQLKKRDRMAMLRQGGRSSILKRTSE